MKSFSVLYHRQECWDETWLGFIFLLELRFSWSLERLFYSREVPHIFLTPFICVYLSNILFISAKSQKKNEHCMHWSQREWEFIQNRVLLWEKKISLNDSTLCWLFRFMDVLQKHRFCLYICNVEHVKCLFIL